MTAMRVPPIFMAVLAGMALAASAARAHAFLDHASPGVGTSVSRSPIFLRIWFTQDLEPAFSTAEVTDQAGNRVDAGAAKVSASDPAELEVKLKPLPPGTYKVSWRVVSVDTHPTDGTFTFRVGS
jgi:copper resistance protein C